MDGVPPTLRWLVGQFLNDRRKFQLIEDFQWPFVLFFLHKQENLHSLWTGWGIWWILFWYTCGFILTWSIREVYLCFLQHPNTSFHRLPHLPLLLRSFVVFPSFSFPPQNRPLPSDLPHSLLGTVRFGVFDLSNVQLCDEHHSPHHIFHHLNHHSHNDPMPKTTLFDYLNWLVIFLLIFN